VLVRLPKGNWYGQIAISEDGQWLYANQQFGNGYLWNLAGDRSEAPSAVLRGQSKLITKAVYSSDGRLLVTGSEDNSAFVWDLTADDPGSSPTILKHKDWVSAITISEDDKWLATGDGSGHAFLWDLMNLEKPITLLVGTGTMSSIKDLEFSSDGKWLAVAEHMTAHLWNLTTLDPTREHTELVGHGYVISDLEISADSRWLATGSWDGTARLWDLTRSDPSDNAVVFGDHAKQGLTVKFSPDSRWFITAETPAFTDLPARVQLWDLHRESPSIEPVTLPGLKAPIQHLAVSPDGLKLTVWGKDRRAYVWTLDADDLLKRARRVAGRNFTPDEWSKYFSETKYRKTFSDLP
jgi:WD40 repeat protein